MESVEFIKCVCPKCQAKYRLPLEAQGRVARCKRCGDKFEVPRKLTLEDSVLTWLSGPTEEEADEVTPVQPKVISMPADAAAADPNSTNRRGPIRMKPTPPSAPAPKQGTA